MKTEIIIQDTFPADLEKSDQEIDLWIKKYVPENLNSKLFQDSDCYKSQSLNNWTRTAMEIVKKI